jgi:hypothetical protein
MNWKCLFKGHLWIKVGGPSHIGDGKFRQFMRCSRCKKTKYYVS